MARVIKAAGSRVVPAVVQDARVEARALLDAAREQAAAVVAQAQDEAETIRRDARASGSEAGKAEVARLLAEAIALREEALDQAQEEMVTLAVAVARRILDASFEADPNWVQKCVREALERARRANEITIRVHPSDLDAVSEMTFAASQRISVQADIDIERGGCVLKSNVGRVDAQLSVRLEALRQAMVEAKRPNE